MRNRLANAHYSGTSALTERERDAFQYDRASEAGRAYTVRVRLCHRFVMRVSVRAAETSIHRNLMNFIALDQSSFPLQIDQIKTVNDITPSNYGDLLCVGSPSGLLWSTPPIAGICLFGPGQKLQHCGLPHETLTESSVLFSKTQDMSCTWCPGCSPANGDTAAQV
jgi:hypothetical protein